MPTACYVLLLTGRAGRQFSAFWELRFDLFPDSRSNLGQKREMTQSNVNSLE